MEKENNIFMAHQPIVDNEINIYGYEFFSRSNENTDKSEIFHTADTDTKTLFNVFSNFDLEKLLNSKKIFLNCVLENSDISNYFDLISPKNVVLEILPCSNKNINLINEIEDKIKLLKSKGFLIACSEIVFQEEYKGWFKLVDYIKFSNLNIENFNVERLKFLLSQITLSKVNNKIIIAEKVETRKQFDLLKKMNFNYFQGFFFSKPVNVSLKITNPGITTLLKLINLVNEEADFKKIEEILKKDVSISFKLLRYLNSYGVGGGEKVESFNRALTILGYKKLLKWLTILLTTIEKGEGTNIITKTALMRARFMENMALEIDKGDADSYFMVGLFSMLDALLNVKLEVALNSINISEEIKNSIINNEGKYVEMLNLIKMLEKNEWIDILSQLYKLNIKNQIMNEKYMEAIKWVEELNLA